MDDCTNGSNQLPKKHIPQKVAMESTHTKQGLTLSFYSCKYVCCVDYCLCKSCTLLSMKSLRVIAQTAMCSIQEMSAPVLMKPVILA